MRSIDLKVATWRRSSYSNSEGGQCLEVADDLPVVPVRDSKKPDIPALVFPAPAWASFVAAVRT
ncbi:DUF397 domain-containing protein [Streptomyces sp. GQFP]|uniref:DUF397 domain-containing protein n=1 Tax=Streptomyces sp. GQFP TaxID=2907545 RepID=UPI001F30F1B6|nr:DUF397 domain-containing protein [Streptomyces sp. GQFP]UIX34974.1 DUF397 domain-containing protein [Streptomyces sp. GQFP]